MKIEIKCAACKSNLEFYQLSCPECEDEDTLVKNVLEEILKIMLSEAKEISEVKENTAYPDDWTDRDIYCSLMGEQSALAQLALAISIDYGGYDEVSEAVEKTFESIRALTPPTDGFKREADFKEEERLDEERAIRRRADLNL